MLWLGVGPGERRLGETHQRTRVIGGLCVGMPHSDVNTGPFPAIEHAGVRSVRALCHTRAE